MEKFRVVCINDKNKPVEVPASSWVEKEEVYTVVGASNMARQGMMVGFKLAEVQMPIDCDYQYYASYRFRPYTDADAEAEKAVEALLEEIGELELV